MERKYFKNLTDKERREIKQNVFRHLNLEDEAKVYNLQRWKRVAAFASAAALIAVVMLVTFRTEKEPEGVNNLIAQTSATEIRQVLLADSSVVILNPSSVLYAAHGYSTGNREVFLEGNGFFKVKKMSADRRFIVHAGSQSVTVLGTQFNVNSRSGRLEVVLTSGSVKVMSDDRRISPEFLKPGDKLKFEATDGEYRKTVVDPLLYSPWIDGEWEFRNTPLSEIALVISEYYNVDIQFNNPETKELKMTAVFPVTSLESLLKVIMETLPVTISQRQQQLIIQ